MVNSCILTSYYDITSNSRTKWLSGQISFTLKRSKSCKDG